MVNSSGGIVSRTIPRTESVSDNWQPHLGADMAEGAIMARAGLDHRFGQPDQLRRPQAMGVSVEGSAGCDGGKRRELAVQGLPP